MADFLNDFSSLKTITIDISAIDVEKVLPIPECVLDQVKGINGVYDITKIQTIDFLEWSQREIFAAKDSSKKVNTFIAELQKEIQKQMRISLFNLIADSNVEFKKEMSNADGNEEKQYLIVLDFSKVEINDKRLFLPWEIMKTGDLTIAKIAYFFRYFDIKRKSNQVLDMYPKKLTVVIVNSSDNQTFKNTIEKFMTKKEGNEKNLFSGGLIDIQILDLKDLTPFAFRLSLKNADIFHFYGDIIKKTDGTPAFKLGDDDVRIERHDSTNWSKIKKMILHSSKEHDLQTFRTYEEAAIKSLQLGIPVTCFIPYLQNSILSTERGVEEYLNSLYDLRGDNIKDGIKTISPVQATSLLSTELFFPAMAEFLPLIYQNSSKPINLKIKIPASKDPSPSKTFIALPPGIEEQDTQKRIERIIRELRASLQGSKKNDTSERTENEMRREELFNDLSDFRLLTKEYVESKLKELRGLDVDGRLSHWDKLIYSNHRELDLKE